MHASDPRPASPLHVVRARRRARTEIALLTMAIGLCGCAADSNGATPITANTARVIVRFAKDVADPADPAFLATLAASARVGRIDLIRPMSGDSYVMLITCDDAAHRPSVDGCTAALARVGATASVLMIELDGRETTR